MQKSKFENHKRVKVSYSDQPAKRDKVWIDIDTGVQYNYDDTRNRWLSSSKTEFEFARKGNADGMYLPLLGDLYDTDDVYLVNHSSIITGVWCRSKSGEQSKAFEIKVNGETTFTFNYDGSDAMLYTNYDLDIPLAKYDEINLYVVKDGKAVRNTVCKLEIARRYDI